MKIFAWFAGVIFFFLGVAMLFTAGWERPPMDSVQSGFRGTGMAQIYNPRTLAEEAPSQQAPEPYPPVSGGPPASMVYQNVEVLGDLSITEFNRLMQAMTDWVAPEGEGCAYCHNEQNYADEGVYTKTVSRRMLQMTMEINSNWQGHVANTGVTCYTCHRGEPVPSNYWYHGGPQAEAMTTMLGMRAGQNVPAVDIGLTSLPTDPFTPFLENDEEIRVVGDTALPTDNRMSIKQTEWTYSLMVHMSESLGVNCTYCHNSRAFAAWEESSPQRVTSWHGINMVQAINADYVAPLSDVFPANRKGPEGDAYKVNCATCHQGAYKPLYGAEMLKHYPSLSGDNSQASLLPEEPLDEGMTEAGAEEAVALTLP